VGAASLSVLKVFINFTEFVLFVNVVGFRMRWAMRISRMGGLRNVCRYWSKSEGKRFLGRRRRGFEDNITMDPTGSGLEGVDFNIVTRGDTCEHGDFPSGFPGARECLD
jgi:hypothetical protein